MKYLLILTLFCFSFLGQASTVTITISPDNPIAGQVVSFTPNAALCSGAEIDPGDGSGPQFVTLPFNHTYTSSGNFPLSFACNGTPSMGAVFSNSTAFTTFIAVAAAPSTSAIPTLGEWGLIILGIIILGIGLVVMKQKKAVLSTIKK